MKGVVAQQMKDAGYSNVEIARAMDISESYVRTLLKAQMDLKGDTLKNSPQWSLRPVVRDMKKVGTTKRTASAGAPDKSFASAEEPVLETARTQAWAIVRGGAMYK